MGPEVSFPCSQGPSTVPYPEPDASTPHLSSLFTQNFLDVLDIYNYNTKRRNNFLI